MKVEQVDATGEVKITLPSGKILLISYPHPSRKHDFRIRTLDHAFLIRMTGGVNTIDIEMRRLGE
jgi:hypothetical protein